MTVAPKANRYAAIIEEIFRRRYSGDEQAVDFDREDMAVSARALGLELPRNLGDLIYSFRYRASLPDSILGTAPSGKTWIIRPAGRGKYRLELVRDIPLVPNASLAAIKVPDATPGMISRYAFNDEQAVLARVRYNRLIDMFLGLVCYSLQNHFRTTVPGLGQVETDEIYVGVDRRGAHYAIPVQAKSGNDRLSPVQIEQDIALCAAKLPDLVCRPIGAQVLPDEVVALMEFTQEDDTVMVAAERQYHLVPPEEMSESDLAKYRQGNL